MRAIGLLALAVSGACTSQPSTTFSEIYPLLFPVETKAQCDFCHGLPTNDISNGKLSMGMDRATAYTALRATSTSSKCGGRPLVVPGDSTSSLLYQKLTSPPCGGTMPLGGTPLTPEILAKVASWIDGGAQDD